MPMSSAKEKNKNFRGSSPRRKESAGPIPRKGGGEGIRGAIHSIRGGKGKRGDDLLASPLRERPF